MEEWIFEPLRIWDHGLLYEEIDEDGVQLTEVNKNNRTTVYIYNKEIPDVIKKLQRRYNNVKH